MVVAGELNRRLSVPDVFERREMQSIQRADRYRKWPQGSRQYGLAEFDQIDSAQKRSRGGTMRPIQAVGMYTVP